MLFVLIPLFMLGFLLVVLNALLRSIRERFVLGVVGGAVRAGLLSLATVEGLRADLAHMAGHPDPSGLQAFILANAPIAGPAVSFGVLFVAYRRTQDLPAADEQRARRPFGAWLSVALIDAVLIVIGFVAGLIAERV